MAQRRIASLFILLLLALAPALAAEPDILQVEHVGKLKRGMSAADLKALLGQPASKTADVLEGATGLYVVTLSYPGQGVFATLSAPEKGGPGSLDRLTVKSPCRFKTARGAAIGDSRERIRSLYGKAINVQESSADQDVVGSIYGGLIFTFKQGRVVEIFLGARAE